MIENILASSLIAPDCTSAGMADTASLSGKKLFFGTGLATREKTSPRFFPIDLLMYVIEGERARREFGLSGVIHEIGDSHALSNLTNEPEKAEHVRQVALWQEGFASHLYEVLGLKELGWQVIRASEFHKQDEWKRIHQVATEVLSAVSQEQNWPKNIVTAYTALQTADVYYWASQGVAIKLGWVRDDLPVALPEDMQRAPPRGDEPMFDRIYHEALPQMAERLGHCPEAMRMHGIYTKSGCAASGPNAIPYIATSEGDRLLLDPQADLREVFSSMRKLPPDTSMQDVNLSARWGGSFERRTPKPDPKREKVMEDYNNWQNYHGFLETLIGQFAELFPSALSQGKPLQMRCEDLYFQVLKLDQIAAHSRPRRQNVPAEGPRPTVPVRKLVLALGSEG